MLNKEAIKAKQEYYAAREKYLKVLCENDAVMAYDAKIEDFANKELFGEILEEAKAFNDDFIAKDVSDELQKMSDEDVHLSAMKDDWLLFKIQGLAMQYGKKITANNSRSR